MNRVWIGYRAETGFQLEGTAADVVRYEEEELGNELLVPSDVRACLARMPASAIIWVCISVEEARYYGDEIVPVWYSQVVGSDGEGGFLVVPLVPEGRKDWRMRPTISRIKKRR